MGTKLGGVIHFGGMLGLKEITTLVKFMVRGSHQKSLQCPLKQTWLFACRDCHIQISYRATEAGRTKCFFVCFFKGAMCNSHSQVG